MSFMHAVEQVFKKYAVFEGRARRSEFWYFQLFQFLVYFVLGILSVTGIFAVFIPIYFLGSLIPNLAVTWRRYHDIGKSGMYYFLIWIPLVGLILTIVWLSQDSQPGINQYGASPKAYSGAGRTRARRREPRRGIWPCSASRGLCRGRPTPCGAARWSLAGTVPA